MLRLTIRRRWRIIGVDFVGGHGQVTVDDQIN
jgi:hypothetical protein